VPVPALAEVAHRGTRRADGPESAEAIAYSCQATQMPVATVPQSVWDLRQYAEDVTSGNARFGQVISALFFLVFNAGVTAGIGLGGLLRGGYDVVQKVRGGPPYPFRRGHVPRHCRTPSATLDVRPGEFVKVKTYEQVLQTVNEDLANRGMNFSPEMVPYCGQTFRVSKRLRRIINEKTGQLIELKNECVILEGADCVGRYAQPFLCPRGMAPYWREIWLDRVEPTGS
jgi:hypothetical protein